jgi:hypothetical protein
MDFTCPFEQQLYWMPRHDSDVVGKRAAPGETGEDRAPAKRGRKQARRGPQKTIFFFKYSGKVPNESLRQKLHAKTFECYVDPSDMYTNAVLHTKKPTRASTLQKTIEIYNSGMLADSAKMILRGQSVADELIITRSREDGMNIGDHGFYKRIIAARDRKDPSYYKWDEATERQIQGPELGDNGVQDDTSATIHTQPKCYSSDQLQKIAPDVHPALVEQLFDTKLLSVLASYQINDGARNMMQKVLDDERVVKLAAGEVGLDVQQKSGYIYAAWTRILPSLHKLGFTFGTAEERVAGLQTAGVPEPFTLVCSFRVLDARGYEKAMHIYFHSLRVYKRKEFFAVSTEEINLFFDQLEGTRSRNSEETARWDFAVMEAGRRLGRSLT